MTCAEVKYYLNDYTKGFLLDEVRVEIHEHLSFCSNCKNVFDEIITIHSGKGVKKKIIEPRKEVWEGVHKRSEKNHAAKKIIPKFFPFVPDKNLETDQLNFNLNFKLAQIEDNKWFTIAGVVSVLALGVIFALMIFDKSPNQFWTAEKISGYPVIESHILTDRGIIKIGEKLITDSESRARLKIGTIGEIDVEPQSEVKIIETKTSEYRLVLSKGRLSVRTWSAPKFFSIKTPTALVKDLGCIYYLSVDEKSSTKLHVKSGWLLMEDKDKKSLIPTGASCYSEISTGLGTPFLNDASNMFKESLYRLDFENGDKAELEIILSESRQKDLITLIHMLKRGDQESRGKIYDRIFQLFKIPQRITRDGIVKGNKDMLGRLWTELGLGSISLYQNL